MNPGYIKQRAKAVFNENKSVTQLTILLFFLYEVILNLLEYFLDDDSLVYFVPTLIRFITLPAMYLGIFMLFLSVSRGHKPELKEMFNGFHYWGKAFAMYFFASLFIFLWALLFIIPGIIEAFSYSMMWFIMADDPDISPLQALRKSKNMMMGHKNELLMLNLSFLGYLILSVMTFGILYIIYVGPYYQIALAEFYESLQEVSDY